MSDLSEALHRRLDDLGAPPVGGETPPEPQTATEEEETILQDADNPEPETGGDDAPAETPAQLKIAELAEQIGWEPSDVYNDVLVPISEDETLSIGQLKDRFGEVEAGKRELETARQQFETERQQFQQQYLSQAGQISEEVAKAQEAKAQIQAQYNLIQWEDLRKEDPAKYSALRQDFMVYHAKADQAVQEAMRKQQEEQNKLLTEQVETHNRKTLDLIPDWRDKAVFEREQPQMVAYAESVGLGREELSTIYHSSARRILRDAWLWNEHQKKVGDQTRRVRNAPKRVLRPGSGGVTASKIAEAKVKDLSDKARKTGRLQDQLEAARAIVQNSMKR